MEHIVEVHNLLYHIGWPGLLSIPKSSVGDEDLFGRIHEDKFVIEFHSANLLIGKDIPIEVWLLDIQEGKLFYGVLALKCSLLSDGHIFSLLMTNCSNDSESVEFDLFVTFAVIRFIRTLTFGFAKPLSPLF
jgi:hypothetical protein